MLIPAVVLGSFEKLLNYVMFSDSLTLIAVASTIFVLRRRQAGERVFRTPLYPLPPILFMLCLLGVALRILVVETPLALGSTAIFLAGWPLFRLARRVSG
jgi:APA family basic amino acid/polyamine antiporter